MTDIRYKVMAARPGELDIRFRMNFGVHVLEKTTTVDWNGAGSFDLLITQVAYVMQYKLQVMADGFNLGQYVGQRGTFTLPIERPQPPPSLPPPP